MEQGEFEFINTVNTLIKEKLINTKNIGIGDDCAIIKDITNKDTLITTDILAEGIHFDLSYYSFYDVGYKAAIVNISDIIVKGASPHSIFVSISIPKNKTLENIISIYDGLLDVCKMYNISILGGDTTSSKKDLFISITALGTIEKNKTILRSGAKVGDRVYVLGALGESDNGLKKLLAGSRDYKDYSIQRHLQPKLYAHKWYEIINKYEISASLDVSDGLLQDLSHIADNSNVSIEVNYNSSWQLVNSDYKSNKNVIDSILSGGEDYAFAFTSSSDIKESDNLIKVGLIVDKEKYNETVVLLDDYKKVISIEHKGFNHF